METDFYRMTIYCIENKLWALMGIRYEKYLRLYVDSVTQNIVIEYE